MQTNPSNPDPADMLATLKISTTTRRSYGGGGTWTSGSIDRHTFQALVFPEHAESASFELGTSRISKLWIKSQATGETVANFDRGWDIEPTTDAAKTIVDLLAAGLAEHVFGN